MLKLFKAALIACLAAFAIPQMAGATTLADIQKRGEVRIGVVTGAPPMGMIAEKGNPTGYDVDVATLVAQYLGLPLKLVPLTPPARIPALQTGQVDATALPSTVAQGLLKQMPEAGLQINFTFFRQAIPWRPCLVISNCINTSTPRSTS